MLKICKTFIPGSNPGVASRLEDCFDSPFFICYNVYMRDDYMQAILEYLLTIPAGKVVTYGQVLCDC